MPLVGTEKRPARTYARVTDSKSVPAGTLSEYDGVPLLASPSMTDDQASGRLPQLSLYLTTYSAQDPDGWQHVLDRARAAEAAGFDRLVVPDHVVFGERLEEYARPEVGGAAGGQQPTGPDGYWLEPLTVLAVVAGITSRIRLGTNILIAALRRPVVLAKTLSSCITQLAVSLSKACPIMVAATSRSTFTLTATAASWLTFPNRMARRLRSFPTN